ncbi:hypothetical protein GCM10009733_107300 [Nonomuraea maheshkhaliensis]|uniref:Uncharacterized protein n=1 Tax=Nonomuraea maheshkhaliensis TaxID=419590 RepID=A0ABN2HUZ7_9ACTN
MARMQEETILDPWPGLDAREAGREAQLANGDPGLVVAQGLPARGGALAFGRERAAGDCVSALEGFIAGVRPGVDVPVVRGADSLRGIRYAALSPVWPRSSRARSSGTPLSAPAYGSGIRQVSRTPAAAGQYVGEETLQVDGRLPQQFTNGCPMNSGKDLVLK